MSDDDVRWKPVQCTRCQRKYVCTPTDDYYLPALHTEWTKGKVCFPCLMAVVAGVERYGKN